MNSIWNEEERNYIRQNAGTLSDEEGARRLSQITGRTISVHAWRKQRQTIGLKKAPGRNVCKILGAPGEAVNKNKQEDVPHVNSTSE